MRLEASLVLVAALAAAPPPASAGRTVDAGPGVDGLGSVAAEWLRERTAEPEPGPMANEHAGRKTGAAPGPASSSSIGAGADAGVFGGYHAVDPQDLPWSLRAGVSVRTALGGDAMGNRLMPCASVWLPFGRAAFVGFGAGFTWSSDGTLGPRGGTGPAPASTTALPAHAAGGGVRAFHAGPAVVVRLGPEWFAAGGVFYRRPTGGAEGSPWVTPHDARDRWGIGVGFGHGWR